MPPRACTETAPPGSSTVRRNSSHSTEKTTNAPATRPIDIASAGRTEAQAALMATRPATQPLAQREASGLPKRTRVMAAAASDAQTAESMVLTTTSGGRTCGPANSSAPARFKPDHPIQASRHPNRTKTALWPGMATGMCSLLYLPRRGPRIHAMASAAKPPTAWIAPEPPASRNPPPRP